MPKVSTREKIIDKAIELYNQYGIEYVGVRELAKELGMKGGNITYYFPTKDDLVSEIASSLSGANTLLMPGTEVKGISGLLRIYEEVYKSQYKYRSLFLSLPNLLAQNKIFADAYRSNQEERKLSMQNRIRNLSSAGYLRLLTEGEEELTLNVMTLITRFWIAEAAVDNMLNEERYVVQMYINRLKELLKLLATDKGKKDIAAYEAKKEKAGQ